MLVLLAYLIIQKLCFCAVNATVITDVTCRNEKQVYLPFKEFKSDACARCYKYMPSVAFREKLQYTKELGTLYDHRTNTTVEVDPFDISEELWNTFSEESFAKKWLSCCRAAMDCCNDMINAPPLSKGIKNCPRTWDGWQCWPDTPAGTTISLPCQEHIYFENGPPSCIKYAHKECLPNGTWYTNEYLREWTNYTTCGKREEHRQYLYFHIATFAISIIFIIPALIIFSAYKQLQVPRVTMHKNLFLSLLLKGFSSILFKSIVVADELKRRDSYQSIMEQNGAGCKILFILTKQISSCFYIVGWALPVVPVGIYAILRATLEDDKCWAFPVEIFEWIMNVPNLLSLLINIFFLCNILRVLVTKLRATHEKEPSQYRKAVRATLVLIPLFGLHFFLVIYKPHSGKCGILQAYTYFSYAMDGLQGCMVALIFCYLNGEVLYLLRRTHQRYKLHNQFRNRKNSGIMRRWSTTLTTMNDSQNHNSHHKTKSGDHKPKETANHSQKVADSNERSKT
ncbi:calcitonin gene-related peptide type 1 receptor [Caerostris extrusa]|uniref:Calcitonin gene-related peptide type 1 receptor n=1 Tax=Caerostris extrusa TaxID=172846 RepID=A0AAV4WR05_CAEEX|nr:calcitonin gene-related peptide type 1 receptor [Caerostris extrusa]